jgi:hypothetical protein
MCVYIPSRCLGSCKVPVSYTSSPPHKNGAPEQSFTLGLRCGPSMGLWDPSIITRTALIGQSVEPVVPTFLIWTSILESRTIYF